MSAWAIRAMAIGAGAMAPLLGACTVDTTPSTTSYGSSSGGYGGSSYGGSSSGASAQPMLVDVDPNLTLTAQPGQGAGVFTEYTAGGHWHVWWTCDTLRSGYSCPFDVAISVPSGAITNVNGEGLGGGDRVSQASPDQLDVGTTTSTGIDAVTFDTSAGAIITIDARMNGVEDGSLMFFVQAGLVNGGYTGALTDPLMFEPSSP